MEKQIRQLRKRYEVKSSLMIKLLKAYFPDKPYLLDESNLQVLLYLGEKQDISYYTEAAKKQRILVQGTERNAVALSFASVSEDTLIQAVAALAEIWT